MNTIWFLFAGLIAVAMLFVLVPVWRYRGDAALSSLAMRRQKNREVFDQREAELALELQQNVIVPEEYTRLLAELQRAFLRDMEALDSHGLKRSALTGGRAILIALVLLIPLLSLWQYRTWGSAADLALPGILNDLRTAQDEADQTAKLNTLADFLHQRFERRPADIQNGYMLGTLYIQLERFGDAESVLSKIAETMAPNADRAAVLGQLAQAQYLLHDTQITPQVQATIDEALALNANEYAVMSILALDAFQKEDVETALGYWRRQLSAATPGSPDAEELRRRIGIVESYLPPKDEVAVDTSGQITLTIDIAPELATKVDDSMRLFVFVRNPAMPMPILAQNIPVPEFPFTITLDNSMSMTGMTVESAAELVAGARISTSGNALPASGDMQTLSQPFVLADMTAPLALVIDEIVP